MAELLTENITWINLNVQDNRNILSELYDFMKKEEIYPAVRAGHSGNGLLSHGFRPVEAKMILDWLKERGIHE